MDLEQLIEKSVENFLRFGVLAALLVQMFDRRSSDIIIRLRESLLPFFLIKRDRSLILQM